MPGWRVSSAVGGPNCPSLSLPRIYGFGTRLDRPSLAPVRPPDRASRPRLPTLCGLPFSHKRYLNHGRTFIPTTAASWRLVASDSILTSSIEARVVIHLGYSIPHHITVRMTPHPVRRRLRRPELAGPRYPRGVCACALPFVRHRNDKAAFVVFFLVETFV
jgi:hypothetical protein